VLTNISPVFALIAIYQTDLRPFAAADWKENDITWKHWRTWARFAKLQGMCDAVGVSLFCCHGTMVTRC